MAKNWYSTPGFRESGHSWFDAGFRKVAAKAKYYLGGRGYGQHMNQRTERTPEGKAVSKMVKEKGMIKTLLHHIKKR